jgi:hypothetical protein
MSENLSNDMDDAARRDFWRQTQMQIDQWFKKLNLTDEEVAAADDVGEKILGGLEVVFQRRKDLQPHLRDVVKSAGVISALIKLTEMEKRRQV